MLLKHLRDKVRNGKHDLPVYLQCLHKVFTPSLQEKMRSFPRPFVGSLALFMVIALMLQRRYNVMQAD